MCQGTKESPVNNEQAAKNQQESGSCQQPRELGMYPSQVNLLMKTQPWLTPSL